ncbi:pimeloyl-ACP methyl ester carboxylesterase [Promicromonospora sukumoe]|uniref:Pimeloyl-ACP methyl ester carboxylesterase n=2 Tax=Promicromonospora sukumoe TaxID=88382 RepID=A0A7W3PE19_9MICO|nr:pimeloyl-ACP methyl ester carboxylesterase [Promicromonospora sukumoe]
MRRMIRYGLTLTAAAGIAGGLLAATPAAGDSDPPAAPEWAACPAGVATTLPLECATIPVPLDYDEPEGEQIEIAISRMASVSPTERRGILLTNPGGPGYSGLSLPGELYDRGIPYSVLNAYDVIGMDPRGVGQSSPVSCGFTLGQAYTSNIPPYAVDAAGVAAHAEVVKDVAAQCAANDPEGRMQHMTTANAARDMDTIRAALGEEKMSFFGLSYGSGLGAAYASLFPERSDRVLVDSNMGGTSLDRDTQRRFGLGLEKRFPDFTKWAAKRDDSYGLGSTPREVRATYFELAKQYDEQPVPGFGGTEFRLYTFLGTYKDAPFATIAQMWQSLKVGDPEAALRQAEQLDTSVPADPAAAATEPAEATEPVPNPSDNALSSYLAYTCNDTEWPEDLSTYQKDVETDRKRYPLFGAASANINPCAFWHNDPVDPPLDVNPEGPRNVMVLQNLRDPATPLLGGELVREAFGDRASLVSVDAGEHGVYVFDDNACALNTATSFLVDGELPRRDMFCRAS